MPRALASSGSSPGRGIARLVPGRLRRITGLPLLTIGFLFLIGGFLLLVLPGVGHGRRDATPAAKATSAAPASHPACEEAQSTISLVPLIHSPSSVSRAGTQGLPYFSFTCFRLGVCQRHRQRPVAVGLDHVRLEAGFLKRLIGLAAWVLSRARYLKSSPTDVEFDFFLSFRFAIPGSREA